MNNVFTIFSIDDYEQLYKDIDRDPIISLNQDYINVGKNVPENLNIQFVNIQNPKPTQNVLGNKRHEYRYYSMDDNYIKISDAEKSGKLSKNFLNLMKKRKSNNRNVKRKIEYESETSSADESEKDMEWNTEQSRNNQNHNINLRSRNINKRKYRYIFYIFHSFLFLNYIF